MSFPLCTFILPEIFRVPSETPDMLKVKLCVFLLAHSEGSKKIQAPHMNKLKGVAEAHRGYV
jgi:hypothetical protein